MIIINWDTVTSQSYFPRWGDGCSDTRRHFVVEGGRSLLYVTVEKRHQSWLSICRKRTETSVIIRALTDNMWAVWKCYWSGHSVGSTAGTGLTRMSFSYRFHEPWTTLCFAVRQTVLSETRSSRDSTAAKTTTIGKICKPPRYWIPCCQTGLSSSGRLRPPAPEAGTVSMS